MFFILIDQEPFVSEFLRCSESELQTPCNFDKIKLIEYREDFSSSNRRDPSSGSSVGNQIWVLGKKALPRHSVVIVLLVLVGRKGVGYKCEHAALLGGIRWSLSQPTVPRVCLLRLCHKSRRTPNGQKKVETKIEKGKQGKRISNRTNSELSFHLVYVSFELEYIWTVTSS